MGAGVGGVGEGVGLGVGGVGGVGGVAGEGVGDAVGAGVGKHVIVNSSETANGESSSMSSSMHTPRVIGVPEKIGVGAPFAMVQLASRKACCVGASQLPPIMTATVPLGMLGSSRSDQHVPAGMVVRLLSPVQLALPMNAADVMLYAGGVGGAGGGDGVSAPALQSVVISVEMPPAETHFPAAPAATRAEMSTAGVVTAAVPEQSAEVYVFEVDAVQVPAYIMDPPTDGAQVPEVAFAVGTERVAVPVQSAVLKVCVQYV